MGKLPGQSGLMDLFGDVPEKGRLVGMSHRRFRGPMLLSSQTRFCLDSWQTIPHSFEF